MPIGRVATRVVFALAFTACAGNRQDKVEAPATDCKQEPPAPLPVIHVGWRLQVFKPGSTEVAGTLDAGTVVGGAAERAINECGVSVKSTHKRCAALAVTPITLHDATSANAAGLRGWYDSIVALLDKCPEDQELAGTCDPHDLWLRGGLTKDVELSAVTDDGQVLALWKLPGAFVAEAAVAKNGTSLPTATFAFDTATFVSKGLGALPGDYPAAEVALTRAGTTYTDAELASYASRYRSPAEWLAEVNRGALGQALYVERSSTRCEGDAASRAACAGRATSEAQKLGDYLPAHNFSIEIDGVVIGGFASATGLATDVEVIGYHDGEDAVTHKRPGKAKYKNISLRVGQGGTGALPSWVKAVLAGTTDRKSGSVIFLDREGQEVARYNLFEAWPVRYESSARGALEGGYTADAVELAAGKVELAP